MNLRYDMINCYVVRPEGAGATGGVDGASGAGGAGDTRGAGGGHELLQLRRAAGEPLAGAWSIVRGGIEEGETAWQAALRELREETGLCPLEFYQLDTIDLFYLVAGDSLWHAPGFCAVVGREAEVVVNEEHDAHRWTPRARIDADFLWPGERNQLAELCREILDDGPAKPYLRISL